VSRIITRGRSEPLELGRQTAVVPTAVRRALILRDKRCRFPGCDRPHRWCDAHHVVHWADGGANSLSNLVLLCRRHHRAVHEGFGLRMIDEVPLFTRNDGTILKDRAAVHVPIETTGVTLPRR
jgi:5-methylcytosine-specific restriction endonuclease McrA